MVGLAEDQVIELYAKRNRRGTLAQPYRRRTLIEKISQTPLEPCEGVEFVGIELAGECDVGPAVFIRQRRQQGAEGQIRAIVDAEAVRGDELKMVSRGGNQSGETVGHRAGGPSLEDNGQGAIAVSG